MASPVAPKLASGILIHGAKLNAGDMTQESFCREVKVSKQGIADCVANHEKPGYFVKENRMAPRFGPGMGLVLGISMGAESLRAALIDANGSVRCEQEAKPKPGRIDLIPGEILPAMRSLARDVLDEAFATADLKVLRRGRSILPLIGVATAWPSPIHRYTKKPVGSVLHERWRGSVESLPERVAKTLGFPANATHAINDANALAISVAFDETRTQNEPAAAESDRAQTLLVVRAGGGIGAGTIAVEKYDPVRPAFLACRLVEGATGLAGEIGHWRVPDAILTRVNKNKRSGLAPLQKNWPCSCGATMHLDSLASGKALVRRIEATKNIELRELGLNAGRKRGSKSEMPEIIATLKDELALAAVRDAGRLIGSALGSPILLLNPTKIVVAGSLAANEALFEGIDSEKETWRDSSFGPNPEILPLAAEKPGFSTLRGAALVVFREQVFRRFDSVFREQGSHETKFLRRTAAGDWVLPD